MVHARPFHQPALDNASPIRNFNDAIMDRRLKILLCVSLVLNLALLAGLVVETGRAQMFHDFWHARVALDESHRELMEKVLAPVDLSSDIVVDQLRFSLLTHGKIIIGRLTNRSKVRAAKIFLTFNIFERGIQRGAAQASVYNVPPGAALQFSTDSFDFEINKFSAPLIEALE